MSSVTCLLSPVSFLLPKTTWLPRLSLGTFASTSLLAVSMFFACHASLSWPNAMGATVDGCDDDDDENVMSFSLCQGLPGKSA